MDEGNSGRLLGDRILLAAFVLSAGLHGAALAVHFVDPEMLRIRASDPPLEIILVNSRSAAAPPKAEALAQANLDGGGANEQGRRTSPLPESFEMRDGDNLESARRLVERLEEEQRHLLTDFAGGDLTQAVAAREMRGQRPDRGSADRTRQQLARMQAEIARQISDYQKRPRRHHFMPSASEYRFARYVEDWRTRIEKIGNEHYPDDARGKIYGSLRMTVAIRKDGSLADAIIEDSSGTQVLDRAARRIVKLASPYPPFPPDIARDTDILEITRTWIFTNDQLATQSAISARSSRLNPSR